MPFMGGLVPVEWCREQTLVIVDGLPVHCTYLPGVHFVRRMGKRHQFHGDWTRLFDIGIPFLCVRPHWMSLVVDGPWLWTRSLGGRFVIQSAMKETPQRVNPADVESLCYSCGDIPNL